MDWNNHLPQEPIKVWSTVAAVLVTLVGAGAALYKWGYDYGKDLSAAELSARKAMDDAQIPEITKNFIAANKDLRQSLDVIGQNQKLMTEVKSYQKQLGEVATARAKEAGVIQDLRDQLQAATIEQTQLRNKMAKLDGDSRQFPVKINTAEKLGGGYAVGVKDGHPNFLEVTFDNKSYQLSAGNSLPTFDIGGKHCFVILLDFVWYSPATGNFELSCKPITP